MGTAGEQSVDIKGAALTGAAAANYNLTTVTATATIEKVPLTITGAEIAKKTYDKTTTATVSNVTFGGLVEVGGQSEALTKGTDYDVAGEFNDANVDQSELRNRNRNP